MQRYIPLTLLTTKACCNASYTTAMDKDARHAIKLEDGGLRVSPTSFDATGEDQISNSDWTDASARYVRLLGRHLLAGNDTHPGGTDAQRVAAEWGEHFRLIRERSNFLERFDTYRTYDIRVRRIWQNNQTFNPGIWHDTLYQRIIEDTLFAQLGTGQTVLSSTKVSGSSTIGHNQPSTNSSFPSRSRHSSAETDRPRRSGADAPTNNKCMYCGKKDHHYRRCRGEEGLLLQRNKERRWVDKDGKSYCIGFNGPTPCTRGDTCMHIHACSLCLARDHGAQRCSIR